MNERPLRSPSRAAWPAMMWPLDPWKLSSLENQQGSWRESWLEATRWWTDALGERSRTWPDANERLLAEIAEGVARRFRGRSVDVQLGGRHVRGVLDRLWLDPRTDQRAFRLELHDVEFDGWKFETVAIDAETVGLTSRPDVSMTVTGINVEARSMVGPLVTCLDRSAPDWRLHVDDDLRIVAARAGGRMQYTLDAVVVDNELHLEVRGMRCGRLRLRVPRWLRLTRSSPVPTLPAGTRVMEARRRGRDVDLRLALPEFRQTLDLARLRDAVLRSDAPATTGGRSHTCR